MGKKNVDDWLTGPAYRDVAVTWGSGDSNGRERSDWTGAKGSDERPAQVPTLKRGLGRHNAEANECP